MFWSKATKNIWKNFILRFILCNILPVAAGGFKCTPYCTLVMRLWKTTLDVNWKWQKPVAKVSIKCDIYQRDSLPPHCSAGGSEHTQSDHQQERRWVQTLKWATISHLLYMDGIKLFTKNKREIDSLIHLTRIYSNNIRMSFRLNNWRDGIWEREDDHNWTSWTTGSQHSRCSGQLQIPGDPTGKWQSWGGSTEVNHSQIPIEGEAGAEESDE